MKHTPNRFPEFFLELRKDVSNILQLLTSTKPDQLDDDNQWLNLDELCKYRPDKPAKATVYAEVQAKKIPCYKKGKKLLFRKTDIDKWLMEGKRKTRTETEKEIADHTDAYLLSRKRASKK